MSKATTPAIFRLIERLQGDRPWGAMLDAGTGARSLRWMGGLATTRWTAVSADPAQLAEARSALDRDPRAGDRLLAGNWTDAGLLAGERYDTVLAEYLVGAMAPYAPGFQSRLLARLRPLVGGRLYVVGLDPYVTGEGGTPAERLVREIGRFRDACLLGAGLTPYSEFAAEWVMERLAECGLGVLFARRFPNHYDLRWVEMQLGTAAAARERWGGPSLRLALAAHAQELRNRAAALCAREGALRSGADYVIVAQPPGAD